jgi:Flp pilus assembly protein TadG
MSAPVRWWRATAGTVTLEFGMIGIAFSGILLLVFELGFLFYAQTALDFAAREAARIMQTGQASPPDQAGFQSTVFCPFLSPLLGCSSVTVVLQPVTDFQSGMTTPPPAPYNSGSAGSLMLLQAIYTPGISLWPLNVLTIVGTAAYQNES